MVTISEVSSTFYQDELGGEGDVALSAEEDEASEAPAPAEMPEISDDNEARSLDEASEASIPAQLTDKADADDEASKPSAPAPLLDEAGAGAKTDREIKYDLEEITYE